MKNALYIFAVLFFILILAYTAFSQSEKRVVINGKQVNYVLVENEPYILINDICQFGYTTNQFSDVSSTNVNGIYYYRLKECCQKVGLVSAEQVGSDLIIQIPEGTYTASSGNAPAGNPTSSQNTSNPLNELIYPNGINIEYQPNYYQYPNEQKLNDYTNNIYYSNGEVLKKSLASEYFYPGGKKIKDSYDIYYYPNGQAVNESLGKAFYPNGKIARDNYGLYFKDGSKTGGAPVVIDEMVDSSGSYVHIGIYQNQINFVFYVQLGYNYYYEVDVVNQTERLLVGETGY